MIELGWKSMGLLALTALPTIDRARWESLDNTPSITGDDRALGVVDFSIFPHLDHPDMPENSLAHAQRWAAGIGGPAYAILVARTCFAPASATATSPRDRALHHQQPGADLLLRITVARPDLSQ